MQHGPNGILTLLEVKLRYDPVGPSVRRSVGVIINERGGKFHFHGNIGALVLFAPKSSLPVIFARSQSLAQEGRDKDKEDKDT